MSNALRRVASLRRVPSSPQFPRLSPPPSPPPPSQRPISALEQLERDLLRCSPCEDLGSPRFPHRCADDQTSSSSSAVRVLRSDGSRLHHLAVRSGDGFDAHQRRRLAASFPSSPAWETACDREADIVRATAAVVGREGNAALDSQLALSGEADTQSARVLEGAARIDDALCAVANEIVPAQLSTNDDTSIAAKHRARNVSRSESTDAAARAVDERVAANLRADCLFEGRVARQIDDASRCEAPAALAAGSEQRHSAATERNPMWKGNETVNSAARAVECSLGAESRTSPEHIRSGAAQPTRPLATKTPVTSATSRNAEDRMANVVDKAILTSLDFRRVVSVAAQAASAAVEDEALQRKQATKEEAPATHHTAAIATAVRAVNQVGGDAAARETCRLSAVTAQAAVAVTKAVASTASQHVAATQRVVKAAASAVDRVALEERTSEALNQLTAEEKLKQNCLQRRAASAVDDALSLETKRTSALHTASIVPLVNVNVDVARALSNLVIVSNRACREFHQIEASRALGDQTRIAANGVRSALRVQYQEAVRTVAHAAGAQKAHLQREHAADDDAALRTAVTHVNGLGRVSSEEEMGAASAVDQHCRHEILASRRQLEAQHRAAERAVTRLCTTRLEPAQVLTAVRHLDASVAQASTAEQIHLIQRAADAVTGLVQLRSADAAVVAAREVDAALGKDARGDYLATGSAPTRTPDTESCSLIPRRADHDVKAAATAVEQLADTHLQEQQRQRLVSNAAAVVDGCLRDDRRAARGIVLGDWMASSITNVVAAVDTEATERDAARAREYDAALTTAVCAVDEEISAMLAAEAVGTELQRQREAIECGPTSRDLAALHELLASAFVDSDNTASLAESLMAAETTADGLTAQADSPLPQSHDTAEYAVSHSEDEAQFQAGGEESQPVSDSRPYSATPAHGQSDGVVDPAPVSQDVNNARDVECSDEAAAQATPAVAANLPVTVEVLNLDKPVARTTMDPAVEQEDLSWTPSSVSSLESVLGQLDYESIRRIILTPPEVAKPVRFPAVHKGL